MDNKVALTKYNLPVIGSIASSCRRSPGVFKCSADCFSKEPGKQPTEGRLYEPKGMKEDINRVCQKTEDLEREALKQDQKRGKAVCWIPRSRKGF